MLLCCTLSKPRHKLGYDLVVLDPSITTEVAGESANESFCFIIEQIIQLTPGFQSENTSFVYDLCDTVD